MNKQARIKELYPNAPKMTTCKVCNGKWPNPILNGSNIVKSMCDDCCEPYILSYFASGKWKKTTKKKRRRRR